MEHRNLETFSLRNLTGLLLTIALSMSFGCSASTVQGPRHAPGVDLAQQWRSPFPAPYGVSQGVAIHASETPDIEAYLLPSVLERNKAPARAERASKAITKAAPQVAAVEAITPVEPEPVLLAMQDAPAPSPDLERYAARDSQSQQQKEFRGGDVIVITSGAILLALLIVLLVLLLT